MPDTPEVVLNTILPFLKHVYPIFEAAVAEATVDEFLSKGDTEIEGCHHSSAIRIRVRRALATIPDGLEYEVEPLTFNGLEVHYLGHEIKFYKAVNGHAPACGSSSTRKDFYQQPLFGEEGKGTENQRLLIIYRISRDGSFLGMDLACPKGVVSDYAPPELHWSIAIPHPATLQAGTPPYVPAPDELDEITADNLARDLGMPLGDERR